MDGKKKNLITYGILGFIVLLTLVTIIHVITLKPIKCGLTCDKNKKALLDAKIYKDTTEVGIVPLDCTLFTASYVPFGNIPLCFKRKKYQYDVADFLFRQCFNVTVTNCFAHRYDFAPQKPFDVVTRISNILGRMYAYFLYSTSLRLGVLVFSGTGNTESWLLNITFSQVPPATLKGYVIGVEAHGGFYAMYASVQQEINDMLECYKNCMDTFLITGNSLGGALSTLAALDLYEYKPIIYTFAAPRSLNKLGSFFVDKYVPDFWRIYNTEDLVTDLPLTVSGENLFPTNPFAPAKWTFSHCGKGKGFTNAYDDFLMNHAMAYENQVMSRVPFGQ